MKRTDTDESIQTLIILPTDYGFIRYHCLAKQHIARHVGISLCNRNLFYEDAQQLPMPSKDICLVCLRVALKNKVEVRYEKHPKGQAA